MAALPLSCSRCHAEADEADLVVIHGRFEHRELCIDAETARVRDCIARQVCPVCGKSRSRYGPFRVLAIHVEEAHGIDVSELRDMALVDKRAKISGDHGGATPEERARKRRAAADRRIFEGPRRKRSFSAAGLAVRQRTVSSVVVPAATAPDVVARRAAAQRKPHPCAVCGIETGDKDRRVCSDACEIEAVRRANRLRASRYWDEHARPCRVCNRPIRQRHRRTCSTECARAAQKASRKPLRR